MPVPYCNNGMVFHQRKQSLQQKYICLSKNSISICNLLNKKRQEKGVSKLLTHPLSCFVLSF